MGRGAARRAAVLLKDSQIEWLTHQLTAASKLVEELCHALVARAAGDDERVQIAQRLLAIRPAVERVVRGAAAAGEAPLTPEQRLRRNVAAHAYAPGLDILTASPAALRQAQRGLRLPGAGGGGLVPGGADLPDVPSWPLGVAEGVGRGPLAEAPMASASGHVRDEVEEEEEEVKAEVEEVEKAEVEEEEDAAAGWLLSSSLAWVFEPRPRGAAKHLRWEPKAALSRGNRFPAVEEQDTALGALVSSGYAWVFEVGAGEPVEPFAWQPKAALEQPVGWRLCSRRRSLRSGWASALLQQARRRAAWLGLGASSAWEETGFLVEPAAASGTVLVDFSGD